MRPSRCSWSITEHCRCNVCFWQEVIIDGLLIHVTVEYFENEERQGTHTGIQLSSVLSILFCEYHLVPWQLLCLSVGSALPDHQAGRCPQGWPDSWWWLLSHRPHSGLSSSRKYLVSDYLAVAGVAMLIPGLHWFESDLRFLKNRQRLWETSWVLHVTRLFKPRLGICLGSDRQRNEISYRLIASCD